MIQYQILQTNMRRTISQILRRILIMRSWELKGLSFSTFFALALSHTSATFSPPKKNFQCNLMFKYLNNSFKTLYILKSFSTQLFIHFPRCWQGEFAYQSKASFISDHFLYSHDFNMWFRGDIAGGNLMLHCSHS